MASFQLSQQEDQEQNCGEDSGFQETLLGSYYEVNNDQFEEDCSHVQEALNRVRQEDLWMEEKGISLAASSQLSSESSVLAKFQGKPIRLEDLDLLDIVGHGAFGEVWLAEYDGEALAVKILKQSNLTKKRLEIFKTEIINHSRLDHPNIVKFYGPCLEKPKLAIVMEYMDCSLYDSLHMCNVSLACSLKCLTRVFKFSF